MAKIKLTKTELKSQREALQRYRRYLPTLQLKKQQLQMEVRELLGALQRLEAEIASIEAKAADWAALLTTAPQEELADLFEVEQWRTLARNIAGINIAVFDELILAETERDLFLAPQWHEELLKVVKQLTVLRLKRQLLEEQRAALEQELRATSQRVNLFEKVKIPEAMENIRKIRICLDDQQTTAVGRAKIAKAKCAARATAG
jgi:V/A-type H+-transporting ATPase subunit D